LTILTRKAWDAIKNTEPSVSAVGNGRVEVSTKLKLVSEDKVLIINFKITAFTNIGTNFNIEHNLEDVLFLIEDDDIFKEVKEFLIEENN